MSVSGNYQGGLVSPKPIKLTTNAKTDVVVAINNNETIASYTITNEHSSSHSSSIVVKCYFHDGATDHLVFIGDVASGKTVFVSDAPLRLLSGHKFKAEAATADKITITPTIISSFANAPSV